MPSARPTAPTMLLRAFGSGGGLSYRGKMTSEPSPARCACHGSSCSPEFGPRPCRSTTTAFGLPFAGTTQYWSLPKSCDSNRGCHMLPHAVAATIAIALTIEIDQHRAARDAITFLDVDG